MMISDGNGTHALSIAISNAMPAYWRCEITPMTKPAIAAISFSIMEQVDLFDRHRLGEIPRLVDVGAAQDGYVIGEQLQRDGEHGGGDEVSSGVHMQRHARTLVDLRAGIARGEHDQLAAARLHLLQVGLEL